MTIRNYALLSCLTLLGACAANSPASVPVAAPVTVASAASPAGTTEEQQQFIKAAGRLGYRVETVKSERRYCKSTDVVESHFPKKECLNEAQMAAKIQSGPDPVSNPSGLNNQGVFTRPGH